MCYFEDEARGPSVTASHLLKQDGVDAQTGGGVGGLAQQAGGQTDTGNTRARLARPQGVISEGRVAAGRVPGVDAPHAFVSQDGEESVEAGPVLAGLRTLAAQLHPVLHQVQRLHEHRRAHPATEPGTGAPSAERRLTAPPAGGKSDARIQAHKKKKRITPLNNL